MSGGGYDLTPAQLEAISTEHSRYSVLASAGSGKTSVLVNRYLWFVEQGLSPDQILTITFTRKAAGEMKTRIVRELRSRGLREEAQVAETGAIQTIDSFLDRILRENAMFAAVDYEFDILATHHASVMADNAIRHVLGTELLEEPDVARFVRKFAGGAMGRDVAGIDHKIVGMVKQVLSALRGTLWSPGALRRMYSEPGNLVDLWLQNVQQDHPDVPFLWEAGQSSAEIIRNMSAALKTAKEPAPIWMKSPSPQAADDIEIDQAIALMKIVCDAWEWLESLMVQQQRFDFSFVARKINSLIKESPEVRDRIRGTYKAVLVDEAQDLDPLQYELLQELDIPNEMLVGDPQQSIYGFRQADKDLFVGRTQEMPVHRLQKNHRSDQGILAFVDTVFRRLWIDEYVPMGDAIDLEDPFASSISSEFDGVELWECGDMEVDLLAKWTGELVAEGTPMSQIAVLVSTSNEANKFAQALDKLAIPHEIVGGRSQYYTRLEVRDIANCLEAAADPVNDLSLLSLLRSPAVNLSFDTIVMLADKKPVFEHLAEFEPPVPEDREKLDRFLEWFAPLTEFADRVPAWELISEVFRLSPWLAVTAARPNGQQELANIRKLFTLATEQPKSFARDFAAEIRRIQGFTHPEGDAPHHDSDAEIVRIMTMHRSKGLEFDVVILPFINGKLWQRNEDVRVDKKSGLVAVQQDKKGGNMFRWLEARQHAEVDAEKLRVLYVAMTRARKRLCVSIPTGNNNSHGSRISSAVGYPRIRPLGVRIRQKS